jgi:hypothetical protein
MTYIEHVRKLVAEKNLDPDKVEEDLITTSLVLESTVEEIAKAFIRAIDWHGPVEPNWPEEWRCSKREEAS